MPKLHFLLYLRHFSSDFENNGTVEISEFFSVGWAIAYKTNFWNRKLLGVWWSPIGVPLFVGVAYPKGTSTTSPLITHAFCVQI